MTENQVKPLNFVEVEKAISGGLKLKLNPLRDYLIGNPAEDEFLMMRNAQTDEIRDSVDLQFFQHSNGEYTPLGTHKFMFDKKYKMKDANLYLRAEYTIKGRNIIINAPSNVDITREKVY